uniref:NADH-ubiquinone oxidoreductase chain 2 n=1 Tax=Diplosoma listerianum TaxID=168635 RepID=D1GL08_9ASCI|nr:NADH dehydrogenase subunit 2 [Diplosoma listerianum]
MFFFIIFMFSLLFFKNMFYSWMTMEILTLIIVFICCKNNNVKNIMKLFYYLMIHTFLGFILIYLIMFSYNNNIILLFLCAKLGGFPGMFWMPEIMPFFSTKNFFILLSLPKVYPMLYFFFLEIDNMFLIKVISFFSIFFGAFGSLFSNNFKTFFTYAGVSQLGFFFLIMMKMKVFLLMLFIGLYFMVLLFFFFKKQKMMNFLPMMCFLSYGGLPFGLPFYFKYMVILNLGNSIFFFVFVSYYLFIVVFLRYVWYYKMNKNMDFNKFFYFFILFFFLFTPLFFFFFM